MIGSRAVVLVLLNLHCAASQSVVRRALAAVRGLYRHNGDESFGRHCVVWGDWEVNGKKFSTKEEASDFFKEKKTSELIALQLDGKNEVHRYASHRMVNVDWDKMKAWCAGKKSNKNKKRADHPDSMPSLHERTDQPHFQQHRPKDALDHMMEEEVPQWEKALNGFGGNSAAGRGSYTLNALSTDNSLFESSSSHSYELSPSSSQSVTSLDSGASTMTSKINMLESEVTELSKKASGLLAGIGASSQGHSLIEAGHHTDSKLLSRVANLESSIGHVQDQVNLLEGELFGSVTAPSARGESGHSLKLKIEKSATQVDELRSRLSALESTPLLGEAAKLEEQAGRLGADAARMFASIGIEGIAAPAIPRDMPLKNRLGSLEEYTQHLLQGAATVENEIVGNSWNRPASDSFQKSAGNSIKDHAASLGQKLHDLDGRVASVAGSNFISDVTKMEEVVSSLSSRVTAMTNKVGLNGKAPGRLPLAPQGTPLKQRLIALEGCINTIQGSTAALEDELAGSAGTMPAHAQQDTLRGKAKLMEMQLENINGRISTLEQQV